MGEAERVLVAAKEGDLTTLRTLRRLVPFATDGFGASTVHHAARNGQLDCVKWLLETIGGEAKLKRSKNGAMALHDCAAQGRLECVKYFVQDCSVPVDIRDVSGHTPLHLAARFGHTEVVKWLLHQGNGNPKAKSRNYMTPVHFAASGGSEVCLDMLLSKAGYSFVNDLAADGTSAMFLAAQDGNLKCLKYLHSVGGKCNTKTRDGVLPIHGAAQNGHLDCLIYLTESGQASWADKDATGATPAHYAASQGHVKVLQWLRTRGDISTVDNLGGTPLHDAAEQGEFECVRYLVETAGLNVMQQDNVHATPVDLANKTTNIKCRDFLKIAASKQAKLLKQQNAVNKKRQVKDDNNWEDLNQHQTTKIAASPGPGGSRFTQALEDPSTSSPKPQATLENVRVPFEDSVFKAIEPRPTRTYLLEESDHNWVVVELGGTRSIDSDRTLQTEVVVPTGVNNDSSALRCDANSTGSNSEQKRNAEPLPKARERSTRLSGSDNREYNAAAAHKGSPKDMRGPPAARGKTISEGVSGTQYQQEPRKVVDNAQNVAIQCSKLCSDIMMSRLKTGQFIPLPRKADKDNPVIPPPQAFCEDGRADQADMAGINSIIWEAMPQWKRQVHLSRRKKEEESRKQAQQQADEDSKKWAGIPLWRVPLIEKKEHEKLKEEQKWIGVPDWKKTVLLKKQNSNGINRKCV